MSLQNHRNSLLVADRCKNRLPLAEVRGGYEKVHRCAGRKRTRGANLRGPSGGVKFVDLQVAGARTVPRTNVGGDRQFPRSWLGRSHDLQTDCSLSVDYRSPPLRLDASAYGSRQLDALERPCRSRKSCGYFGGGHIFQPQPDASLLCIRSIGLEDLVCRHRIEPVDDFGVTGNDASQQLRLKSGKRQPLGTDRVIAAHRRTTQSDGLIPPVEVLQRKFAGGRKNRR